MLFRARGLCKDSDVCQLPDGSQVIFYQLYPVYKEELDYAKSRGKKELVERLGAVGGRIYNPRRFNVGLHCPERPLTMLYAGGEHALKRAEMELDADERSAYLYPAVFLRWMIEHKLTGAEFEAWQGQAADALEPSSALRRQTPSRPPTWDPNRLKYTKFRRSLQGQTCRPPKPGIHRREPARPHRVRLADRRLDTSPSPCTAQA
jgi:hypothetical protein